MAFDASTHGKEVVDKFGDHAKGKTIVVTGPTTGSLGGSSAVAMAAAQPAQVILVGRNESKITGTSDEIKKASPSTKVDFVQCDMADNASVREAGKKINSLVSSIDILINSAGVMALKDYSKSKDGFEMQLAANHVGHFLLTNLIMPKILAAKGEARVISITSMGYALQPFKFDDYNFSDGKTYNPWLSYGQAKTGNCLFTAGLTQKLKGRNVTPLVLHPGLILSTGILSGVTQDMFAEGFELAKAANNGEPPPQESPKEVDQGISTILCAALDPQYKDAPGTFLRDCQPVKDVIPHGNDPAQAEKLWALSEDFVGMKFNY